MKKLIFLSMMNLLFICQYSQNYQWARKGGLWAYDYGYGITTDKDGNVYLAGKFELNANFSGTVLTCQGNHDIFVAKYNSSGTLLWIRWAGGYTGDYAWAVAVDPAGNVIVTGEIEGSGNTIKFQGSSITLTCVGNNDVPILKYDPNGTLLWARRAGGSNNDRGLSISCDNGGNIYVCGHYGDFISFGSTTLPGMGGGNDIFLAKYDPNGNFLWARRAGGTGRDEAKTVKCDADGNVYITGLFEFTAKFEGQSISSPNGFFDMFLAKYSSSGSLLWLQTASGAYDDVGWNLALDNFGKVYVTGEFNASCKFSGISVNTSGSADIFVACYTTSGAIQWVKKAGGSLVDRARGMGTDGTKIYITGQFGASANFGSFNLQAADSSDIFFACMDNSGNFLWATSAGGGPDAYENLGYESGISICAEPSGNVYASGSFLNGATLGSTSLGSYSRTDVFLTRISSTPSSGGGGGGSGGGGGGSTVYTDLVVAGASWKYLDNGTDQGTGWRAPSFSDATWKTGNAQLGYGDGDEATVVSYGPSSTNKYITTYFRKNFNVTDVAAISSLELNLVRDDGAVVYINGTEVYRTNMPTGAVNYKTLATTYIDGSGESTFLNANINKSVLVNGNNLIAVEIHQSGAASSDISFNLKLRSASITADEIPETEGEQADGANQESYTGGYTNGDMEDAEFINFLNARSYAANTTTGLSDRFSNSALISFFPNPARDAFTLTIGTEKEDRKEQCCAESTATRYTIFVYDLAGSEVFSSRISSGSSQVNISELCPGLYFIEIRNEDRRVFFEKLMVR